MKKEIYFAISVYDKFEELAVLVDIIRNNYKGNYGIVVCSNYTDAASELEKLDLDDFIIGDDIKFYPNFSSVRGYVNITSRVFDSVSKGVKLAIEHGARYIIHLHGDAWPLKESEILDIINYMKEKNKLFAARGLGFSYTKGNHPYGHLDDMFMFFDADFVRDEKIFNYPALNYLPPQVNIHGIFATIAVCNCRLINFYFYDDNLSLFYWDGKIKKMPFQRVKPSVYDPKRGFLHVHVDAFPDNMGKAVQTTYLKKTNNILGNHIQNYIKKYEIPETKYLKKLKNIEDELDRKLKIRLFDVKIFGRDFSLKKKILKSFSIKNFAANLVRIVFQKILKPLIHKLSGKKPVQLNYIWPTKIKDFYLEELDIDDYPNKDKLWFLRE